MQDHPLVRGHPEARRRMVVVAASVRGQTDLVTREPEPPPEVHVLEVREERGVEATELEEELPVDEDRASAGKGQILAVDDRDLGDWIPVGERPAPPVEGDVSVGEVDALPHDVEDQPADAAVAGARVVRGDELPQPSGVEAHVVVRDREALGL